MAFLFLGIGEAFPRKTLCLWDDFGDFTGRPPCVCFWCVPIHPYAHVPTCPLPTCPLPIGPYVYKPIGPCAHVPICPSRMPMCPYAHVPICPCPYAHVPMCPHHRNWNFGMNPSAHVFVRMLSTLTADTPCLCFCCLRETGQGPSVGFTP